MKLPLIPYQFYRRFAFGINCSYFIVLVLVPGIGWNKQRQKDG